MDLYDVSEVELIYKTKGKTTDRPKVTKAVDAFKIFHSYWDENKIELVEQSKIILLNRNGRVLGVSHLSTGGINHTIFDARLIFVTALKANASSIILAHNHPSANLQPSHADRQLTQRLMDAGKLLDIEVLDHLVITTEGFYSFAEQMAYERVQRHDRIYYEALQPF
jgi:DNA repair protein RadC